MRHFATCFDARYLVTGLALWQSLRRHNPEAVLWVLALDVETERAIRKIRKDGLRVVTLSELEGADPELLAVRAQRSWPEYVFTLSPCWPRYLLRREPELEAVMTLDADMAFFESAENIWDELGEHEVLIVEHCFPQFLSHLLVRGRFNVGVQCFRNSGVGRAVLDDWRQRCLAWCRDRPEKGRYADQGYLDEWPARWPGVKIADHPGINLAPWNWLSHHVRVQEGRVLVAGRPLVLFHFAGFRERRGRIDSGHLEYGVMPWRLRCAIYGAYVRDRERLRAQMTSVTTGGGPPARGARAAWKTQLLEFAFGSIWWSPWLVSTGFGLGRYSGRVLAWFRGRSRVAPRPRS